MFIIDPSRLEEYGPTGAGQITRRQMAADIARYCLGVSLLPSFVMAADDKSSKREKGDAVSKKTGRAKHLIYLFMAGAQSQLDTFDVKPNAKKDITGDTKPISTKVAGLQISEYLPELAKQANRLAIIRSMNTSTAAHEQARYLMGTSYKQIATTKHPGLGSWTHKMLGRIHKTLPVAVQIGGGQGPGYLGSEFAPVPIGDPALGLQNTKSPSYVTNDTFDKRMQLSGVFDAEFRKKANENKKVTGYDDLYKDAIQLLRSDDLKVFNINDEPDEQKKAYGETRFGKGCLLARRLVEKGVRYVEVSLGGWDMHNDLWGKDKMPKLAGELDQTFAALLNDLDKRGLLKDTLVVMGTEFGRKPEVNQNSGRDHHPSSFCSVLAGGPIKGGQAYGKSDDRAFRVDENGVTPEDLNATIGVALGISPTHEIHSPDGRPFTIGNKGEPVLALLS